jgi:hypothetical protein
MAGWVVWSERQGLYVCGAGGRSVGTIDNGKGTNWKLSISVRPPVSDNFGQIQYIRVWSLVRRADDPGRLLL